MLNWFIDVGAFKEDHIEVDKILRNLICEFLLEDLKKEPSRVYYLNANNWITYNSAYILDYCDKIVLINCDLLSSGYDVLKNSSSKDSFKEWFYKQKELGYCRILEGDKMVDFLLTDTRIREVSDFIY